MLDPVTNLELRRLAERYARHADSGDSDEFVQAFLPDARVHVYHPPEATTTMSDMRGHDELRAIPTMLDKAYDRTFHLIANSSYEVDGDRATGWVYCLAHHLSTTRHGGTSYVMHIRYEDEYGRDAGGAWRIADRRVNIEWTETRTTNRAP